MKATIKVIGRQVEEIESCWRRGADGGEGKSRGGERRERV